MTTDQTSSPKISNEALFLTLTIDTNEGRDVATCDIMGEFIQTDIPEGADKVHIKLDGAMVDLLAKINPRELIPSGLNRVSHFERELRHL